MITLNNETKVLNNQKLFKKIYSVIKKLWNWIVNKSCIRILE